MTTTLILKVMSNPLDASWNGTEIDCITYLFTNIFIYISGSIMILLFLRNRLVLFVTSAGNWIELPKMFHFYPYIVSLSILTYTISLIIFAIYFHADSSSSSSSFECDYKWNAHFLAIFLPSTIMFALTYFLDLFTFISIIVQCRSIVSTVRTSQILPQSESSNVNRTSISKNNKRVNKMVIRLLKPAVALAATNIVAFVSIVWLNTAQWHLVANINFVLVSICILFMYKDPMAHLKYILTPCKVQSRGLTILSLFSSPSKPKKPTFLCQRSMTTLPSAAIKKILSSMPQRSSIPLVFPKKIIVCARASSV